MIVAPLFFSRCMNDGLRANSPVAVYKNIYSINAKTTAPTHRYRRLKVQLPLPLPDNFFNKDVNANRRVSRLMGKLFILPMYLDDVVAVKTIFFPF